MGYLNQNKLENEKDAEKFNKVIQDMNKSGNQDMLGEMIKGKNIQLSKKKLILNIIESTSLNQAWFIWILTQRAQQCLIGLL